MSSPYNEKESQSPVGSQRTFVDHEATIRSQESRSFAGQDGNGSSSMTDDEGNDTEMDRRQSIVQELAREYTRHSVATNGVDQSALFGSDDPDSPLNPNGKKFSARTWARTIANVTNEHGSGYRTAGFCYENLNVFGYGQETDYQKDVGNVWLELPTLARNLVSKRGSQRRIDILRNFNGVVEAGEMLVVLGPPGSGCSTFLKAISGEMNGIYTDERAYFNYQGISAKELHDHHAGDAIYTAEVDVHYPQLSVGDTLTFASRARCPRTLPPGVTADQYCDHLRDVVMAMYGISHTVNTRVGDNYIRGVSGGERKRVTIAEATLSNAPLQCWDNSTRGLDSANAVEFCKTLRLQSDLFRQTCAVSIYQAPQTAYDLFDKVAVLYEGRQIFFGRTTDAKDYFVNLGFDKENKALKAQIEQYKADHPLDGADAEAFRNQKQTVQAKSQRLKSPFILSYGQQVKLCIWRGFKLLKGSPGLTIFALTANSATALIMSSLFYNLPETTSSFYSRSAVLFVAILANAFSSALEILTQYSQRPIIEKQRRYAFYHASAEALSSVLVDMPYKITNTIFYDLIIYFMTNLNRDPGNFFFFLFTTFLMVLSMSGLFRSIASLSRTLSQAMVPASVLMLALVIFTGFVVPVDYMLGWCRWINYLDPVGYGFESLMINEFHNRDYQCDSFVPSPAVPGYENATISNMVCSSVGSVPGATFVSGDAYINSQYKYFNSHKWRNIGILIAFVIALHALYLAATEYIAAKKSKGEVLVFRRGVTPPAKVQADVEGSLSGPIPVLDKESDVPSNDAAIQGSTSVFHWSKVCYDVKIKTETRRILNNVDGWVKPGTLTALMGVSGAGKTTLLDVLADRVSVGVITGEMLVDGKIRDSSAEKLAYVDKVIELLGMQEYADAVGGRTVYFGDIGKNSQTLIDYFNRNGAPKCPEGENPAEWMLSAIGAAPGTSSDVDWPEAWKASPEYRDVQAELERLKVESPASTEDAQLAHREFAAPLWNQFLIVTHRVFQQYWRTPSYIYSKFILCCSVALFIGLVFLNAPLTIQGLQNQMFAIFQILSIFGQLVQQQMPHFVIQRSLYEVRERPSKTYSWKVFMLSQIVTEIPWNSLMSVFMFICVYYPVGFDGNGNPDQKHERGVLMWLLFWQFLIFTCTFANACIAITDTAEMGGNLANVLFMMCLLFCGVLATPDAMPRFWIFMYRVSPFTYLISSVLSTGLANTAVRCSSNEYVHFDPPANQTCAAYMSDYISAAGGYLENPTATADCSFCSVENTNAFLASISSSFDNRWRDFGIGMVYIVFNIVAALFLYWLVRMPKKGKKKA
ncbi:hypothetical protein KVR01_003416 [Diaporthe batatas]|uniref:uncharacterized protein n=1 Tax=Diaporthe batatas TaxID=748121 RepID=UPI001D0506B3|nr:uncharacterized protein KVR01_003416 [Diaporthe batatas]KAG8167727.1 hypothetical protein KVR01_003416 [Diaporthe batatas]